MIDCKKWVHYELCLDFVCSKQDMERDTDCDYFEESRPRGEWIEHRQFLAMGYFFSEYECSNCHDDIRQKTEWQFCPNCGASMKKGSEAE